MSCIHHLNTDKHLIFFNLFFFFNLLSHLYTTINSAKCGENITIASLGLGVGADNPAYIE